MPNILKRKYTQDETFEKLSLEINNSANFVNSSEIDSKFYSFHLEDAQTPHYDPFSEEQEKFSSSCENSLVMANYAKNACRS